jgi:macrolide-specific efflux system membrane fusion protein
MKKTLFLICLLLVCGGGGYYWWSQNKDAPVSSEQIQTTEYEVKRGSLKSTVTAQGTLEPKNYVDVGAQISGEIVKINAQIGDDVKVGDLIAEIDADVYEAIVKSAQAQIKILEAKIAQQQASIKQARWKYNRSKKLYKEKFTSKQTLEDAEIDLEVKKAGLLSLEAELEQAYSTLDESETNLSYTKIYSPMSGTIVDQSVEEGETINARQTTPTIVQVANMSVMTAKAQVAEADIMKLKVGMSAYFTTLGSGKRRWKGIIRQILPTPENDNGVVLYNVLMDVQNNDYSLLPGMTTQMFFIVNEMDDVPIIPVSALAKPLYDQNTKEGKAYEVWVKNNGGEPEARTVIIGLQDRTQAAVISGISVGDVVISKPQTGSSKSGYRRKMRMRL